MTASASFNTFIVPFDMKGCICHFAKWQIHPLICKGTIYTAVHRWNPATAYLSNKHVLHFGFGLFLRQDLLTSKVGLSITAFDFDLFFCFSSITAYFSSKLLSRGECHLIHLTILRRFSWSSLALCTQRWPKTPFFSFILVNSYHLFASASVISVCNNYLL